MFFFLFFIILWNHWQPCSGALEHPAIVAMIDYTFGLKELHPALGMPHEDRRSKLESLSVQTFVYTLTMVSNQLCWSTSIPHWTWIQIKYVLNQYKTGAIAKLFRNSPTPNMPMIGSNSTTCLINGARRWTVLLTGDESQRTLVREQCKC